ncbi:tetratricopeptide repeat protein [Longimicrobium sp.]|uniref:tetratricopeptide repeat protein n=1 Tax=Longimicrobium sp. TaxID=2029185 RepID=UPI002E378D2F|nr:tetratricopeptide repeat protein [Longimicrobium sp.]HEX6041693.1 tetratricopeptide repeat protein [Longimicrobium sp.]
MTTDSTSAHRQRGWLLAQQGRHDMAEREYRLALAQDPHDADTHALLALVLAEHDDRRAEALQEAQAAIGLAPDHPFPRYVEARVHLEAGRWDEARRAAEQAIEMDPDDADAYTVLAAAHSGRRRWREMLDAADEALAIDPGHVGAANLRAQALVHLDRRGEAGSTLRGALARAPESSTTHANQGWTRLHEGDRQGALTHFREALRLDPQSTWAREGLAEAMKARNPVYGAMLRYFLWMNRLEPRTRWMVILGGYFGYRLLRSVSAANPGLAPWLLPLMIAYGAFVLLSWTAPQIFNAVLLASKEGRYVLLPEQRLSGALMAAGIGVVAALLVAALAGLEWAWLGVLLFAVLLIPLGATFNGPRGRATRVMSIVTSSLYVIAAASLALAATGRTEAAGTLSTVVFLGVVITSWGVNLRG